MLYMNLTQAGKEAMFGPRTKVPTGCPCWFDLSRSDCSCCETNGVQCGEPMQQYCTKKEEGRQAGCLGVPTNHWTLSTTGYPCYFNTSCTDCAWCAAGGAQCGITGDKGPDSAAGARCWDPDDPGYCDGVPGDCLHINMCDSEAECKFNVKFGQFREHHTYQCKSDWTGNGQQCYDSQGNPSSETVSSGDVSLTMAVTNNYYVYPHNSSEFPQGPGETNLVNNIKALFQARATCASESNCSSNHFKTKVLVWLRFMATLVCVCLGALEKKTNIKLTKASAGVIVKNVSLWGGDAVFNNLDLRLDVLEEELQLPFSLVSGHIHELQIHVPWTRLHTEPIVLTINTIECVLKLPTDVRSLGSVSESATPITSGVHSQSIPTNILSDKEYSLWLQWTIPQCTWTMVAGHPGTQTKLTFLFEDASASIDQQEAYTKLKFRIRSITGKHFVENNVGDFAPGSFPGRIISCQPDLLKTIYAFSPESAAVEILSEDDDVPVNCLSKGVFNMTITKAECQNVIRKLKSSSKDQILLIDPLNQPKRFLTEFDFEINPLDIFLKSTLIPAILEVFQPLLQFKISSKPGATKSTTDLLLQFNNNNLPMICMKSEKLRMFVEFPRTNLMNSLDKQLQTT